jgi:bifunctional enzyme CysN/CysC
MITGASTADLAVILIDARRGVLTQTRRHSYLVSLIGIKQVILAINKMDLVNYSHEVFDRILGDYTAFAAQLSIDRIVPIPISALMGDNITQPSGNMGWYHGPTLIAHLEAVPIASQQHTAPFRMPVQWVNRPHRRGPGASWRPGTDHAIGQAKPRRARVDRWRCAIRAIRPIRDLDTGR